MTQSMTLYQPSSLILSSPVDHITPEQKDDMIHAVEIWKESAPRTERTEYIADRDTHLIKWLWHTGMRISDALAIRFDDISTDSETVRFIVAKRSRNTPFVHTITLSKAMMFETMKYRDRWQIVHTQSGGRLFPITRQNVGKQLSKYRNLTHIPMSISAHKFRHGCAMNLLNQGVPSVEIAFRLAHSSTQVTESVYARMNTDIERKMLEGIEW